MSYPVQKGPSWDPLPCPPLLPCGTCPNDLLDLDVRGINLPGKFSDGLAGVLVGGGIDVVLHPKPCRCRGWSMKKGRLHTPQACSLTSKDGTKELPTTWGARPRPGVPLDGSQLSQTHCPIPPPPRAPLLSSFSGRSDSNSPAPTSRPHPHLGCCTAAVAPCSQFHAASWGTKTRVLQSHSRLSPPQSTPQRPRSCQGSGAGGSQTQGPGSAGGRGCWWGFPWRTPGLSGLGGRRREWYLAVVGRGLPLEDESQHSDGRQQKEG